MIAVALAIIVLAASVVAHRFWPQPPAAEPESTPTPTPASLLEERLRELVVVTLKSGEAFRGVLCELDDKVWVLRSAEALVPNSRPVSVDGELVVLVTSIAYANKP